MLGGPMYALENGMNAKWLAVLFCIFTSIAAFGIGNTVQANSIAVMVKETMGVSPHISGGIMAVLTAVVILGGVKSIARVCEMLVPFMAIFYVIGCIIILGINANQLASAVSLIFSSAFTPQAAGGGFVGASVIMAMRYGIARGLFSNESGLGSAPIVAAAAQTRNQVRQALVSMTGTFWDTVVVCAMTGLVLVTAVLQNPTGLDKLSGAALTKAAFAQIPTIGPIVLTVGLLTFVFSTILGWSYYGERAMEYLLGKKAIMPYRIAWVIAVYVGSVTSLALVWDLADAMNALMAIPNLVALLTLSGVLVADTQKFLWDDGGLEIESDETAKEVA
jgi:AGCS family alanine or glycine:cation symporter